MSAFNWVGQLIDLIVSVVPRFVRIRTTHLGVKWPRCKAPVELRPGIRWYWPVITEIEVIVAARQTNSLPPQSISLQDGACISVRGVVAYRIANIVDAIGGKNWDVDDTVTDLCQAAIMQVLKVYSCEDLQDIDHLNAEITERSRDVLSSYGVDIETCRLVECVESTTYRVLGQADHLIPCDQD